MALVLNHQTAAEFVARFRAAYKESNKVQCVKLAHWLYERYLAGDITAEQVKTAFGFTDPQWIVFRDKVTDLHAAWELVEGALGE